MKKATKSTILFGIVLMALMLIQLYSISNNGYASYLETRISDVEKDMKEDGFSSNQIMTISSAIRGTSSMLYYHTRMDLYIIILANTMGLIFVFSLFTSLSKKEDKKHL